MSSRFMIKLVLIGDGAVGKTSLRSRFMGRGFRTDHLMTIGADFSTVDKQIILNDKNYHTIFQIWDIAGQKRFTEMRARFFHGAMAGMCVFDITRPESFTNMKNWIEELWRHNGKGVIPLVLIGNKSDLRDKKSVTVEKATEYAEALTGKTREHGFNVEYVETSAKDGLNIDLAFEVMGKKVIDVSKRR